MENSEMFTELETELLNLTSAIRQLVCRAHERKLDFWNAFDPAVYIGANARGWFSEVFVLDKQGIPGKNHWCVGRIEGFKKRAETVQKTVAALKSGGVMYPFNQIIDLTLD